MIDAQHGNVGARITQVQRLHVESMLIRLRRSNPDCDKKQERRRDLGDHEQFAKVPSAAAGYAARAFLHGRRQIYARGAWSRRKSERHAGEKGKA